MSQTIVYVLLAISCTAFIYGMFFKRTEPATSNGVILSRLTKQDDDYVNVALKITHAKNLHEYKDAAKSISAFQRKYAYSATGNVDTERLYSLLEQKEKDIIN